MNTQLKPLLDALNDAPELYDLHGQTEKMFAQLRTNYVIFDATRKFQLAMVLAGSSDMQIRLFTDQQRSQFLHLLSSAYEAYTLHTNGSSVASNMVAVINDAPLPPSERQGEQALRGLDELLGRHEMARPVPRTDWAQAIDPAILDQQIF